MNISLSGNVHFGSVCVKKLRNHRILSDLWYQFRTIIGDFCLIVFYTLHTIYQYYTISKCIVVINSHVIRFIRTDVSLQVYVGGHLILQNLIVMIKKETISFRNGIKTNSRKLNI